MISAGLLSDVSDYQTLFDSWHFAGKSPDLEYKYLFLMQLPANATTTTTQSASILTKKWIWFSSKFSNEYFLISELPQLSHLILLRFFSHCFYQCWVCWVYAVFQSPIGRCIRVLRRMPRCVADDLVAGVRERWQE